MENRKQKTVPALFAAVISYLAGRAPELDARHFEQLGRDYVVVNIDGRHFERQFARFTTNGLQWCAAVVTVDERGESRYAGSVDNIGTGVPHDSEDAEAIGEGIIRCMNERRELKEREGRELNFKRLVAAFVEADDPTLEPEVSYSITQKAARLCVRVRLRANKAGVFEEVGGAWSAGVQTLGRDGLWGVLVGDGEELFVADFFNRFGGGRDDEEEEGGAEYADEPDVLTLADVAALDYGRDAEEGAAQALAAAILAACRQYRETHGEPEGEFREYFDLPEKFYNGGGGNGSDWRACFWIEAGTRFVIYRKGGEPPLLYPVGRAYQGVEPVDALYQRLRPILKLSGPKLREVFTEEQGDPHAVIAELVDSGLADEGDIIRIMRDLKKSQEAVTV